MTKEEQLGMSTGKANAILNRDILWMLIEETGRNKCFHCGEPMSRSTFSIEHKVPWMHSENPKGLFFSLENISFSHHSCNCAAARTPVGKPGRKRPPSHGTLYEYKLGCRCPECAEAKREEGQRRKLAYDPEQRRKKYLSKGN